MHGATEPVGVQEQERTLRGILRVGVVVLCAMLLTSPFGAVGLRRGLFVYGIGLVLHLLHLRLLTRAPTRAVAISHCLSYFIWVSLVLALHVGGLRAQAVAVYPPLVLMAGLVWSGRAAILMAVLVTAAGALLAALEAAHVLPQQPTPMTAWRLWLVLSACVVVTAALIRYALAIIARGHAEREKREQLEQRLSQSQRLESLGRMAAGVAHDFNNLLTVILASADGLAMRRPAGDADVTAIHEAATRAATLTRQLLMFGRKRTPQAESVELKRAVLEARALFERLLNEQVELQLPAVADPECYALVDRSQLDQVLVNLVVNARDAMPQGGRIRIEVGRGDAGDLRFPKLGAHAWLAVGDTGVGIAPELHARIFEPFFTTKEAGHGSGIGLATIEDIVTHSGGAISFTSEVGRGTTFYVALPVAEAPSASDARALSRSPFLSPRP